MKKLSLLAGVLALVVMVPACVWADAPAKAPAVAPAKAPAVAPALAPAAAANAPKDRAAYSIGVAIARNMKSSGTDVDLDSLKQGLGDAMSGGKLALSDEEMQAAMEEFRRVAVEKNTQRIKELGAANKAAGEKFQTENKAKEGIVTLPDGLQYKVITKGEGKLPQSTDTVTVNYRGTLLDGTEFDSTAKRGKPAEFPLAPGMLVKGMTEALLLMPVGSKWTVYIPGPLAYGENGRGQLIGPNATLVFEVEVLGIKETAAAPAAPTTPAAPKK